MFYSNGIKVVPQDIYHLLSPIALAYWIIGDGYNERGGLILCTDSYSLPDVISLMNVLQIRYRLVCTLRMHNKKEISPYRVPPVPPKPYKIERNFISIMI
jgi:hypothetical protein